MAKKISKTPPTFDAINADFMALFNELQDKSDRDIALSMAAMVDDCLHAAFRQVLVEDQKAVSDKKVFPALFDSYGPLSTLSARIDFAFALGWIGPNLRTLLHTIRKIRNEFAHHYQITSFDHPDIVRLFDKLNYPDMMAVAIGPSLSLRSRFFIVAQSAVTWIQLNVLPIKPFEVKQDPKLREYIRDGVTVFRDLS